MLAGSIRFFDGSERGSVYDTDTSRSFTKSAFSRYIVCPIGSVIFVGELAAPQVARSSGETPGLARRSQFVRVDAYSMPMTRRYTMQFNVNY